MKNVTDFEDDRAEIAFLQASFTGEKFTNEPSDQARRKRKAEVSAQDLQTGTQLA